MKNSKLKEDFIRLAAITALNRVKENMSYRELAKKLNLPITVLSRYKNYYFKPPVERSLRIIKILKEENLIPNSFLESFLLEMERTIAKFQRPDILLFRTYKINKEILEKFPCLAKIRLKCPSCNSHKTWLAAKNNFEFLILKCLNCKKYFTSLVEFEFAWSEENDEYLIEHYNEDFEALDKHKTKNFLTLSY